MIKVIERSRFADVFRIWRESKAVMRSEAEPEGCYFVHDIPTKLRYIDPLMKGVRASGADAESAAAIEENLSYKISNYMHLGFALPAEG